MHHLIRVLQGIIVFLFLSFVHAQNSTSVDSLLNEVGDDYILELGDEFALRYILNNEFSKLITGNTLGGLGNYAAVNTVDNTLKAGINIVRENKIIGITISGGATDGITNIVTNSKLNSNINLGITLHRLFAGSEVATFVTDIDEINKKTKEIRQKYESDKIAAKTFLSTSLKTLREKEKAQAAIKAKIKELNTTDSPKLSSLKKQRLMLEQELKLLEAKKVFYGKKENQEKLILESKKKRDDPKNEDPFKEKTFALDKLKVEAYQYEYDGLIAKNKKALSAVKTEIGNYENKDSKLKELNAEAKVLENSIKQLKFKRKYYEEKDLDIILELANKMEADQKKNWQRLKKIRATDINFSWSSIGVEISYQSLNLFDATRPEDEQIFVENDLAPKFFVSYSGYLNRPILKRKRKKERSKEEDDIRFLLEEVEVKHIRYYSFGFNGTYGNNSAQLELVEVKDTETVSGQREVVRSQKAYVGEFEEEELSGQFFGEYYQFVGNKNNVGFHLKGTLDVGAFRPITSARAGLIVPFTSSKDQKSNVNLEFFFGLNDIFSNTTKNTLLGRNVFGIQATLPLDFKLF